MFRITANAAGAQITNLEATGQITKQGNEILIYGRYMVINEVRENDVACELALAEIKDPREKVADNNDRPKP